MGLMHPTAILAFDVHTIPGSSLFALHRIYLSKTVELGRCLILMLQASLRRKEGEVVWFSCTIGMGILYTDGRRRLLKNVPMWG